MREDEAKELAIERVKRMDGVRLIHEESKGQHLFVFVCVIDGEEESENKKAS